MTDLQPVRRALLSVSDKTDLVEFATALSSRGVELISTGGTAGALRGAGLEVTDVAEVTGFPEMMNGRVKTLHPAVHGGLLALRSDSAHLNAMAEHGFGMIDLLVVNLYPFEASVASGADHDATIGCIDIGGPAMIRSAAKNHEFVNVVVDAADYKDVLDELQARDGQTSLDFRRRLALTAFSRTAAYDAAISAWMADTQRETAPRRRVFAGTLARRLRYGENPHQAAAFYKDGSSLPGVATAVQHQGGELSYNNINDADAALRLVAEFDPADGPAAAIIKHANPSGVARGESFEQAFGRAFDCDRTSAFGGIVALNGTLDGETARAIAEIFAEVVIAPEATDDAKAVLAAKRKLRLLTTGGLPCSSASRVSVRQVSGGWLVQAEDSGACTAVDLKVVTRVAPTREQVDDLLFAWRVAKHVKSNAIVYARDLGTVGIGAGQMSRVDSSTIAALKAGRMARDLGLAESMASGSVVASDAFFPFPDGLLAAAEAGAKAVIQPGGSKRDDAVIEAADAAGLAMVFSGMRHFRH
ncbi:MAG: bifunctional phosphoribosylaminoimidazolecarboxamide formyltransferase/IMP cyclohydrolase [Boseongicola sp. SB0677_bin_26]|nr:bifunctional phosphoribosylaminoimidazolecarboxamide formyltransferase/IMP cyclohydrolase [Boseongicola sp. SB0665_bin_10]MYG24684.1 bifunctional phosphoribosylaminoimidazolecarboxamide formyltransferase/IMP cyclohydrolase [Boseongicola sp. SB0677_bin_26]